MNVIHQLVIYLLNLFYQAVKVATFAKLRLELLDGLLDLSDFLALLSDAVLRGFDSSSHQ